MLYYNDLDKLLGETAALMEKLEQLDRAAETLRKLSESIVQSCVELKPRHSDMAQDLERLRRLQEVLRVYVFPEGVEEPAVPRQPSPASVLSSMQAR